MTAMLVYLHPDDRAAGVHINAVFGRNLDKLEGGRVVGERLGRVGAVALCDDESARAALVACNKKERGEDWVRIGCGFEGLGEDYRCLAG